MLCHDYHVFLLALVKTSILLSLAYLPTCGPLLWGEQPQGSMQIAPQNTYFPSTTSCIYENLVF